MIVAAHVCISVTQRLEAVTNLSQNSITKLFRDLRDTHTDSTELERTSVCRFGVGVSHIFKTWCLTGSNTFGGSLCLQPKISHVQMTKALHSFCLPLQWHQCCRNAGGCSRVVHKQRNRAWMCLASLVAAVAAMYSASHDDSAISDSVHAPALSKNPSSMITHRGTDLPVGLSPAQSLSVNTQPEIHRTTQISQKTLRRNGVCF